MRIGAVIAVIVIVCTPRRWQYRVPADDAGACCGHTMNASDVHAGPTGRRIGSARPAHFSVARSGRPLASGRRGRCGGPLQAKGRRYARTSRTLSVSLSGPCRYQPAPIP
jgi:hypothetical protein